MKKSYLGRQDLPRGLRNNNPANLVKTGIQWKGKIPDSTDSRFEQFRELKYGIRALYRQIKTDLQDRDMTLSQFINKFAPSFENNTNKYIEFLQNATGFHPNSKVSLNNDNIKRIARAIITIENGSKYSHYVTEQDLNEALEISGLSLKKK